MPFIKQDRRENIDHILTCPDSGGPEPGDRCYVFYKGMVDRWRAKPRWTTAHEIVTDLYESIPLDNVDDRVARGLAWAVFFQLHVMPYELKKREENGDI